MRQRAALTLGEAGRLQSPMRRASGDGNFVPDIGPCRRSSMVLLMTRRTARSACFAAATSRGVAVPISALAPVARSKTGARVNEQRTP